MALAVTHGDHSCLCVCVSRDAGGMELFVKEVRGTSLAGSQIFLIKLINFSFPSVFFPGLINFADLISFC